MNVREAALRALEEMERAAAYSTAAVRRSIGRGGGSGRTDDIESDDGAGASASVGFVTRDRALLRELVLGVTRRKLTLDSIIFLHSTVKQHRVSPVILNILRLGAYQLLYLDKIPASAACNESVKLAKKYGNEGSARYVNALLRKIASQRSGGAGIAEGGASGAELLSVRYSYPRWLCDKWLALYGFAFAAAMMDAGNRRPELSIRANTLRTTPAELEEKLALRGFSVSRGKYSANALTIANPGYFAISPEFAGGLFTVQDEASMLAAEALGPQPGDKVMDVCAAPGGKCGYIAELAGGLADILAADIRPHRVALMEQNAARLGHKSISCRIMDALDFCADLENTMDKVLLDAPCSGLGVIGRKPEIKWNRGPADIESAASLQAALLANAARYVKSGGALVYSVCTTEPEECENVIERFLGGNDCFVPEDLHGRLPPGLWECNAGADCGNVGAGAGTGAEGAAAGLYIYPHIHGIDGFYIARLNKL